MSTEYLGWVRTEYFGWMSTEYFVLVSTEYLTDSQKVIFFAGDTEHKAVLVVLFQLQEERARTG